MRIYSIVSAALSGVLMAGVSTIAFAGSCENGKCNSSFNEAIAPYEGVPSAVCRTGLTANSRVSTCSVRSVVHAAPAEPVAPINYYYSTPYGYLKTFAYKNTPNVNIMQVYARAPMAPLNNVPVRFSTAGFVGAGFVGGCNPVATNYCGNKAVITIPAPAPVLPAPLPVVQPAPIAPVQTYSNTYTADNVIGHVSGGSYTVTKPGTPDYWEKTSGATVVSGMPATQIVCRRAGTPATTHTVNVVRPVIGVPTPIPTPVPFCLPGQAYFASMAPVAMPMAGGRWTQ